MFITKDGYILVVIEHWNDWQKAVPSGSINLRGSLILNYSMFFSLSIV